MACDMCGVSNKSLEVLVSEYATDEVNTVCKDCLHIANEHMRKIEDINHKVKVTAIQRFMSVFKQRNLQK